MLPREDFIFTIGYDGPAAVVDKQAKKKYGKLSTEELAGKGLFRAAYSSAVFSGNKEELKMVADAYRGLAEQSSAGISEAALSATDLSQADLSQADLSAADLSQADLSALDRLFGVFPVDVKRVISI